MNPRTVRFLFSAPLLSAWIISRVAFRAFTAAGVSCGRAAAADEAAADGSENSLRAAAIADESMFTTRLPPFENFFKLKKRNRRPVAYSRQPPNETSSQ